LLIYWWVFYNGAPARTLVIKINHESFIGTRDTQSRYPSTAASGVTDGAISGRRHFKVADLQFKSSPGGRLLFGRALGMKCDLQLRGGLFDKGLTAAAVS
jgi:hypothetical protein